MDEAIPRRRKVWGWGYQGEGPTPAERDAVAAMVAARFGVREVSFEAPPPVEALDLRPPRVHPPEALAHLCSDGPYERAVHAYGKSYRDLVRSLRGDYPHPPDVVAYPRTEDDLVALFDWCAEAGAAAIPFGGGTSVVGGVEPDVGDRFAGAVTIDLTRMAGVVEVDEVSRAARIRGGTLGPDIEDALRPFGLTLRHYPQSFEYSTLGGWIATRSAGHHATLATHIEDRVESLRAVAPAGVVETGRFPASGAGPDPNRLFAGSEGTLGVITEAWVRVEPRPRWRSSAAVRFDGLRQAAHGARALAQSGLHPSNCRVLDPNEALVSGAGDGSAALLLVGFESADHPLEPWLARSLEIARDSGGLVDEGSVRHRSEENGSRGGPVGTWRSTFLRAPYLRDVLVSMGMITETFETAVTWDRWERLHSAVLAAVAETLSAVGASPVVVSCRFTHVYPDGPAPYYTVIAPGRRGDEVAQWDAVKAAASDAIVTNGGTITHHHGVGREHRPWYGSGYTAGIALLGPPAEIGSGAPGWHAGNLDPPRRPRGTNG